MGFPIVSTALLPPPRRSRRPARRAPTGRGGGGDVLEVPALGAPPPCSGSTTRCKRSTKGVVGEVGDRLRADPWRHPDADQRARVRGACQLWSDYTQYLYLPRLRDSEVMLGAVRQGVSLLTWDPDTFAYASAYDEPARRYVGLVTSCWRAPFRRPRRRVRAREAQRCRPAKSSRPGTRASSATAPSCCRYHSRRQRPGNWRWPVKTRRPGAAHPLLWPSLS
jgi:hypothetical protein